MAGRCHCAIDWYGAKTTATTIRNTLEDVARFIAIRTYSGVKDPAEINRRAEAEQATEKARDRVRQTLADLIPNPPEVTIGEMMSQIRPAPAMAPR